MRPAERVGQPLQAETTIGDKDLTPLEQHFVARLDMLIEQRAAQMQKDPSDKLALRLLARALYSTYMDLVGSGLGEMASARLEKAQLGIH